MDTRIGYIETRRGYYGLVHWFNVAGKKYGLCQIGYQYPTRLVDKKLKNADDPKLKAELDKILKRRGL